MAKDRETNEEKPTYWARIPAKIRYDKDLHPGAKVLYAEIDCLSRRKGYCWAQNCYFEDKFGVSTDTVTRWIKQLVCKDYISCQINKANGNSRALSPIPKSTLDLMNNSVAPDDPIRKDADSNPQESDDPIRKDADSYPQESDDPIRKDADSYPQESDDPIRKDADSYNKMNIKRELEERKGFSPPLPDFLNPEKTKGKVYLTAKQKYPLASSGFYGWFENEVLMRFPKFNGGILNSTTIRDWDKKLFEKYGDMISTAGVIKLLDKTRGNIPGWHEVIKEAQKIFNKMPDYEKMDDAELVKTYNSVSDSMKLYISTIRPDVNELVNSRKECAV